MGIKRYQDIKTELHSLGRSGADLSRLSGIPYRRLSGFLTGYWALRFEEIDRINMVILQWQSEAGDSIDIMLKPNTPDNDRIQVPNKGVE